MANGETVMYSWPDFVKSLKNNKNNIQELRSFFFQKTSKVHTVKFMPRLILGRYAIIFIFLQIMNLINLIGLIQTKRKIPLA